MTIKHFLKNRSVQNAGWLIGGKVVQSAINFVVVIITARYLKPDNYGLLNYAAAYTAFFTSVCTLGINSVIVKEFVDHPKGEGTILGTALVLRSTSSFLSALLILAASCIMDAGEPETILIVALSSIGLVFHVLESFQFWFQSRLESKVTSIASLLAYLVTASYKIYLLAARKTVTYFALATSLDYICVGLVLLIAYRRHGGARLRFSWPYGKTLLGKSCHYILPSLMVSIYGQTDRLMLKQMISGTEVGYYATAVSVCSMWCFVLSAIIDSVIPTIMKDHADGKLAQYQRSNKLLYAMIFYISLFVSCGFTLLARPLIGILYGEAYLPAVVPLRIITWYTAFSYLGVARNAWVVCENKQKYLIWVYLSAAVSNVVLNSLMIPLWGTAGAAAASLLSQIITTLVTPYMMRELRPNAVMMLEAIALKGIRRGSVSAE